MCLLPGLCCCCESITKGLRCLLFLILVALSIVLGGYLTKAGYSLLVNEPLPSIVQECEENYFKETIPFYSSIEEADEFSSDALETLIESLILSSGQESELDDIEYWAGELTVLFDSESDWRSQWIEELCDNMLYDTNGDVDLWAQLGFPEFWIYDWWTLLAGVIFTATWLFVLGIIGCLFDAGKSACTCATVRAILWECFCDAPKRSSPGTERKKNRLLVLEEEEQIGTEGYY